MLGSAWQKLHSSRWFWRVLQLFLVVAPLWYVFQSLQRNWQELGSYELHFDAWYLVSALLLIMCAFALLPLAGQQALDAVGSPTSYRRAYWAYYISQFSKYLPGGIWMFPGRAVALQRLNINVLTSTSAMIIELVLLVAAAFLLFVLQQLTTSHIIGVFNWWWVALAIFPVALFLTPRFSGLLLKYVSEVFSKASPRVQLSSNNLVIILTIDILFWLITGLGLYFLVASLHPLHFGSWWNLTSAFSISWIAGFLAFLTPAGLGIREGALAFLLAPLLPTPLPAVIALLARLWWTVAEVVSVALAVLVGRFTGIGRSREAFQMTGSGEL